MSHCSARTSNTVLNRMGKSRHALGPDLWEKLSSLLPLHHILSEFLINTFNNVAKVILISYFYTVAISMIQKW